MFIIVVLHRMVMTEKRGREDKSKNISDDEKKKTSGLTEELLSEYQDSVGVFTNKELLQISHVVTDDRIVSREDEINDFVSEIGPAVRGGQPNHVMLFGKTGTGKSLVTRHVMDKVDKITSNNDTEFNSVYIDCNQMNTETQVVRYAADSLNEKDKTDIEIHDSGYGKSVYYDRLWSILNKLYDVAVLILDEVDKLTPEESNDLLYELSRAGESEKIDCKLAVVGISNKIKYPNSGWDQRTHSAFKPQEYVFDPYDSEQIIEILSRREDAFREGALDQSAIRLCAALSAQNHGDARRAIDILRNAGEEANSENSENVTEDHVRRAVEKADMDRFRKLLMGMPVQQKTTLYTLALLMEKRDDEAFHTNEIHETYEHICSDHGKEPRSMWTVRDEYLDELEFLGLTKTYKTSKGKSSPPRKYHTLTEPSEMIRRILEEDL